jgi:predicted ATP-dependent Lon-type protease
VTREELVPLLEIAVEMRKRVTDQLRRILPTEFSALSGSNGRRKRWPSLDDLDQQTIGNILNTGIESKEQ